MEEVVEEAEQRALMQVGLHAVVAAVLLRVLLLQLELYGYVLLGALRQLLRDEQEQAGAPAAARAWRLYYDYNGDNTSRFR